MRAIRCILAVAALLLPVVASAQIVICASASPDGGGGCPIEWSCDCSPPYSCTAIPEMVCGDEVAPGVWYCGPEDLPPHNLLAYSCQSEDGPKRMRTAPQGG